MKKFLLSMIAMVFAAINVNADVKTWDFSKFTDQVVLAGDNYTVEYDGLTLVGNTSATYTSDYVSAKAGFHMNGTSSSKSRYIKYTPTVDGKMTVTYRSNNATATDRITAIANKVVKGTDVATLLATEGVVAAGLTDGATNQTISGDLKAGTTYYIYLAYGGQSILKLEYETTSVSYCKVEFSLPYRKNAADVVEKVIYNIPESGSGDVKEITGWPTGMFQVKTGTKMQITLDEEYYVVDSVLINDKKVAGNKGVYETKVNEFTEVEIFALPVELAVKSTDLTKNGGSVSFNYPMEVIKNKCYVSAVKTKNIATQATLSVDPADARKVKVAFADVLAPGDYTLDIEAGALKSKKGVELPSQKVAFNVDFGIESAEFTLEGANLTFSKKVSFYAGSKKWCYVTSAKTREIATKANLAISSENPCVVIATFADKLVPGEYTLDIEDKLIQSRDGEEFTNEKVSFAIADPVLAESSPAKGSKVAAWPNTITMTFDTPIAMGVHAAAIVYGKNKVIELPLDKVSVTGKQVSLNVKDYNISRSDVKVQVWLDDIKDPYETKFTYELLVKSSDFTKEGGAIIMNDEVEFKDGKESVKCYVSCVETKNIATQATLTVDPLYGKAINVEFPEVLQPGGYTLDIPDATIFSKEGAVLASQKIAFTIGFGVVTADFASDNGKLTFSKSVAVMYDAETVCKVYDSADNEVATAKLAISKENTKELDVTFDKVLVPGEYAIEIPNGMIQSREGELFTYEKVLVTVKAPALLETTPKNNGKVTKMPENIVFKFDENIATVETARLVVWNGGVVEEEITPDEIAVKDNSVYFNIKDLKVECPNNITLSMTLTGSDSIYKTTFYYGPEFKLASSEFNQANGKLVFTDAASLVKGKSHVCNIAYIKTKDIATTATLSIDAADPKIVKVEYDEPLKAGSYTLDIPEDMIESAFAEKFASASIAIKVDFSYESIEATSKEANVVFNKHIAFAIPPKVVCSVTPVKGRSIATVATLEIDKENLDVLKAVFDEELEPGDYTLDIYDHQIQSIDGELLASCKIPFTVEAPFAIESSKFNRKGGQLTFNDGVEFVDPAKEHKCYVSDVKMKSIETMAKLSIDGENTISVEFADEITEAGDYTLDIPADMIKSVNGETLASVKVAFTISPATGISFVNAIAGGDTSVRYNLQGQRVGNNAKGIIIVNGKKISVK